MAGNPFLFLAPLGGTLAFQDRAGGGSIHVYDPRFAVHDLENCPLVNAELSRKRHEAHRWTKGSDFLRFLLRQFCANPASNVFGVSNDLHMVRVDTRPIPAQVVNPHSGWDRAVLGNPVIAMGLLLGGLRQIDHSVPSVVDGSLPSPARGYVSAILNYVSLGSALVRIVTANVPNVLALDAGTRSVRLGRYRSHLTATAHAKAARVRWVIGSRVHLGPERVKAFSASNLVPIGKSVRFELRVKGFQRKSLFALRADTVFFGDSRHIPSFQLSHYTRTGTVRHAC